MSEEIVTHVHPDGRFISWETRKTIHDNQLVHRSINVFVFHPDGRMLVQLRNRNKRNFASYWDVSCSGHVEKCDHPNDDPNATEAAFLSAATRELSEEVGICADLTVVGEYPPFEGVNYERTMIYSCVSEGPFSLQPEEVEEVRWVTKEELAQLTPLTPLLGCMVEKVLGWTSLSKG